MLEYINIKQGAHIQLQIGVPSVPKDNSKHQYLSFIWNLNDEVFEIWVDSICVPLEKDDVLCLTYLQKHDISVNRNVNVVQIRFNREFYCVHTNDSEVSCNGLLFFGSNQLPIVKLDKQERDLLITWLGVIQEEFRENDSNQEEMLRILLKRFIIRCTRLAKKQLMLTTLNQDEYDLIRQFNVLVEENYKTVKKVSKYAHLMHRSPKTISNVFAKSQSISPLQIIHQRIVMEADRYLMYTDMPIKQISLELGYDDSTQFSKLYKTVRGSSMTDFRNGH